MVPRIKLLGANRDLAAPPCGGRVDRTDYRCAESTHGLMRAGKHACVARKRGGHPPRRSLDKRAQKRASAIKQPQKVPHVFQDYLFRIDPDDTIGEVVHGSSRPLSLPARDLCTASGADAGFAHAFWRAVQGARYTGEPQCIECRDCSNGHESIYEVWLVPTLAHDLIGIVRDITESRRATHTLRAREVADRRMISDLWEATHRLQAERDRLLRLATRDCLTGVWNRHAIFELLAKALASAQREGRPVTVIMADIDGFKSINDRFGHPAGDDVLREIARRLCSCVRRSDEVGRYGGEEFLIVLSGCGGRAAMTRAEQFRASIGSEPILVAGEQLHVTCSFGLHSVSGGTYDGDEAVRKADAALYGAKHIGRDRCVSLHH